MLVDDDSGSNEIKNKLKNDDSTKPFSYYVENLYVIFIPPENGGGERAIEDLFDKKTLETKVAGKIFSLEAKIDPKKEYGKTVFAEKVVKANQNSINFDGFKEIFNRFKDVIEDYQQKRAEQQEAAK